MLAERYGWGPWDFARLTPQEIQQYLKGAEIRSERKNRAAQSGHTPSRSQQQRENDALQKFA